MNCTLSWQDRKRLIDRNIIKTRQEPYFLGPESKGTAFAEHLADVLGADIVKGLGLKEVTKVRKLPEECALFVTAIRQR